MLTLSGKPPAQDEKELKAFLDLIQAEKPMSYCEVGAREGDTFYEIVSRMPAGAKAVAVDLPEAGWGHKGSYKKLKRAVKELRKLGYKAEMLIGDSKDKGIVNLVKVFSPKYDLIFIDGDHTWVGVKSDWDNYGPLGGIVAFHDITADRDPTGERGHDKIKVPKLWAEVKAQYRHVEFITEGSFCGIGVAWVSDKLNAAESS